MIAVGDPAPDAAFALGDGRAVRLSELWLARPLVLLFLRHFG